MNQKNYKAKSKKEKCKEIGHKLLKITQLCKLKSTNLKGSHLKPISKCRMWTNKWLAWRKFFNTCFLPPSQKCATNRKSLSLQQFDLNTVLNSTSCFNYTPKTQRLKTAGKTLETTRRALSAKKHNPIKQLIYTETINSKL